MKLHSDNKKINILFLNPFYTFLVFFLISLFAGIINIRYISDTLFGAAIISINLCWIYLTKNSKEEEKEVRKEKDLIGYAMLVFSSFCFFASFLFSVILK